MQHTVDQTGGAEDKDNEISTAEIAPTFDKLYYNASNSLGDHTHGTNWSESISPSEAQLTVDESRDENIQDREINYDRVDSDAANEGVKQNSQEDDFNAVLSLLDKNISSATERKSIVPEEETCEGIVPHFFNGKTLEESFETFMRLHNCQPLLDDDESLSYHPRMRGIKDDHSTLRPGEKGSKESQEHPHPRPYTYDDDDEEDDNEEEHMEEAQTEEDREIIHSLECELEDTRKSLQQFSTSHMAAMAIQRRDYENLVVGKGVLEAQLQATEEQLVEAKNNAIKMNISLQRMKDKNKQLGNKLIEIEIEQEEREEKRLERELAEKKWGENLKQHEKERSRLENLVKHLRLDLNDARSTIKRIEKERKRERKHYNHLFEIAANDKARLEVEVENNTELRKKFFVMEKKLANKKEKENGFSSQLDQANEQIVQRDSENKKLRSQLAAANAMLKEKNHQCEELENQCDTHKGELHRLHEINGSMNDELARAAKENQKLKEELRIYKKVNKQLQIRDTGREKFDESKQMREAAICDFGHVTTELSINNTMETWKANSGFPKNPLDEGNTSFSPKLYQYNEEGVPLNGPNTNIRKTRIEELHAMEKQEFDAARGRFENLCAEFRKAARQAGGKDDLLYHEVDGLGDREQERLYDSLQNSYISSESEDDFHVGTSVTNFDSIVLGDNPKQVSERVKKLKEKYDRNKSNSSM